MRNIYIAADHGGFLAKTMLLEHLKDYAPIDLGTHSSERVDYPDYAEKLAYAIKNDTESVGILLCGSGVGMSIAANRYTHLRAALVSEPLSAELARHHNDANVMCLGERLLGVDMLKICVDVFLKTPFKAGRHQQRVDKLLLLR